MDYQETFSPVVRPESVRIILAIAAELGVEVHHMDVNTALLNGEVDEEIYMTQPKDMSTLAKRTWSADLRGVCTD